jgi:hypothetical protein
MCSMNSQLPDLDRPEKSVSIMILETGRELVYTNMSRRQALLNAFIQHSLGNFNTWDYAPLYRRYHDLVVVSKSGNTAAISKDGTTYCVIMQNKAAIAAAAEHTDLRREPVRFYRTNSPYMDALRGVAGKTRHEETQEDYDCQVRDTE